MRAFRPDVERSPRKAVFETEKIECCFFHLSQAHLRTCRMQELGLRILYIERKNIAAVARNLTARLLHRVRCSQRLQGTQEKSPYGD